MIMKESDITGQSRRRQTTRSGNKPARKGIENMAAKDVKFRLRRAREDAKQE